MGKANEDPSGGLHNVLAVGTSLTGTVETASDFRLNGYINGDIVCKGKIIIGPKGSVKGNIKTENAEIFGTVDGTIQSQERLVLKSTAVVKGDVTIRTLEIEPGAKLDGSCSMSEKEKITGTSSFANEQKLNVEK